MELSHSFPDPTPIYDKKAFKEAFAQNYAGYDPVTECSRQMLRYKWHNGIMNPNWRHTTRASLSTGKTIHDIRSNAENWNGIELRFSLGLFAVPQAYERAVQTMNDLGFNVVLSTLAMMDRYDEGIPQYYPDDIHQFYSDRDLEIDRGHDHEDKMIVALTHSTSGTGSLKNGADPTKVRQYIRRGIIGAVDSAPFLRYGGCKLGIFSKL